MDAELDTLETYHNPDKLIKLSSWSGYLSWVVLILIVIQILWALVTDVPQLLEQSPRAMDIALIFISYLYRLAIGLFYFVVLQAFSEGINIWMDIYENTQSAQSQGDADLQ